MKIGIDCVLDERMTRSLKNPAFVRRVFGEAEQQEIFAVKNTAKAAASCFAVKEAFGKALGCGIMTQFALSDVQLLHRSNGTPYVKLSGRARALVGRKRVKVSITHENGYTFAVVVL